MTGAARGPGKRKASFAPELDMTILVPSRKRANNMPIIRSLLPSAVICIDEREIDDYSPLVPKDRLLVHPPMKGLPAVLNWAQEEIKSEILFEVDDDFAGVRSLVGSHRFIMDPDEILAIIENGARCCKDLGLTTFVFSRSANHLLFRPADRPIIPTGMVCNGFGIMGKARHRKWDVNMLGRADVDWALRCLLDDRVIYNDVRFYFDSGPAFTGTGGNVGIISPEQFTKASEAIRAKWGAHVSFDAPNFEKKRNVSPLSIKVPRRNKAATK